MTENKARMVHVAAAVLRRGNTVLLAQRPHDKAFAGLWEFPGGKMEAGETPERTLVRELEEELGIQVAEADVTPFMHVSHAYEAMQLEMQVFTVSRWQGEPKALEHQALHFVPVDALLTEYLARTPDADKPIFHKLALEKTA